VWGASPGFHRVHLFNLTEKSWGGWKEKVAKSEDLTNGDGAAKKRKQKDFEGKEKNSRQRFALMKRGGGQNKRKVGAFVKSPEVVPNRGVEKIGLLEGGSSTCKQRKGSSTRLRNAIRGIGPQAYTEPQERNGEERR